MTPIVIDPPQDEPITLEEAKAHLRVVFDDEDADIARMITAARQACEERTQRALMPQTVGIALPSFAARIELPRMPYIDGLQVKYTDQDGAEQTLSSGFVLNDYVEPPSIHLAYGASWPAVQSGPTAVRIQYRAGYEGGVPEALKQWMLLAIGTMYEHRESLVAGVSVAELPDGFMSLLLQPYIVYL
jgi:uncharacterized phiE125 gp8 family phage protein